MARCISNINNYIGLREAKPTTSAARLRMTFI